MLNPWEIAILVMASLYNTTEPHENCCYRFLLIVFTL
jgi:hypothetical protein